MLKRFSYAVAGIALALTPFTVIHAQTAPTISIGISQFSPGTQVTVGTALTFQINISGFTTPTYGVGDSFSGSTITPSDIAYNGAFSWTPTAADIGYHQLRISATDGNGDSATIMQNVTVAAVGSVSMLSISPGAQVAAGTRVGFNVQANGFTPPIYSVSDSFSGTSVNNNDVDQNGYFSWTPDASQTGTHNITIRVSDYNGHHGSISQQIIVGAPSSLVAVSSPASVPVTVGAIFTSTLDVGSTGSQVTALQQRLTTNGFYTGPITGFFGAVTAVAVKKFQAAHGLSPVGAVGPATRALLNK